MKRFIVGAVLGFSLIANAQPELDKNAQAAFESKLNRVQGALKSSGAQTVMCEPPTASTCSFEGYCGKLAEGQQGTYLYKDSEGHQIPNYAYQKLTQQALLCNGKVSLPASDDPFVTPELFANKDNQKKLAEQSARTQKLFEKVRGQVVAVLEKRKTVRNSKQIDNMIARVKSVKFKTIDVAGIKPPATISSKLSELGCEMPNAAYNLQDHTITICPQTMNMPEGALVGTLAHEFGHSFDPCSAALPYSKDGAVFPDWMNIMVGMNKSKSTIDRISPKENPYASVISCLQEPKSINVKIPKKSDLQAAVDKKRKFLEGEMQEAQDEDQEVGEGGESNSRGGNRDATFAALDQEDENINKYYDEYNGCPALSSSILINESFADWISGETISDMAAALPAGKAKEFAFTSTGIFYSAGCSEVVDKVAEKAKALSSKCQAMKAFGEGSAGHEEETMPHPDTARRVNRIYYAKPEIKKALNCQGGETGTPCE
jgi:hypothetical protein